MPTFEKALEAYMSAPHRRRVSRKADCVTARVEHLREMLMDGKQHSWTVIAARCGYATATSAMVAAKQNGFWPKPPSVEDL